MAREFLKDVIKEAIVNHRSKRNKQEMYMDYYLGEHTEILSKTVDNESKPCNKLIFTFPELIVETNHSYLYGKPLSWNVRTCDHDDEHKQAQDFLEEVQNIYFDNDEEQTTGSILRSSSIFGEAIEIHYIDKEGNIRFMEVPATEVVFIGDEHSDFHYALWYRSHTKYAQKGGKLECIETIKADLFGKDSVMQFEKEDDEFVFVSETAYEFGELPVIKYKNRGSITSEGQSDIKTVISLVDAYNKAVSSMMDTLEYHGDPYLVLKNFGFDIDEIRKMIESRVLALNGDKDTDAHFLSWDNNTQGYENFLDRIERLMFVLSFTPDLFSKEGLASGDSGIAIKMKYSGADLKANSRERSITQGLRKRLRLIAKQLELKTGKPYFTNGIYRLIDIQFNRSIPQNLKELVEVVSALAGVVSDRTRLNLLPFIEDLEEELAHKESEQGVPIDFGDDDA